MLHSKPEYEFQWIPRADKQDSDWGQSRHVFDGSYWQYKAVTFLCFTKSSVSDISEHIKMLQSGSCHVKPVCVDKLVYKKCLHANPAHLEEL